MATLLDDELELDDELLDDAFAPSFGAAPPAPPIDAIPENKDDGARPANAPDSVKAAAQAMAAPAFNAQDFLQRTPDDEAEVLSYKQALGQARQGRLAADIGQLGENFASQLLGTKPSSDFWQRQRAEAEGPLETLKALSGVRAGQEARKQKGLAQGLAFQTAQTNMLNALTAQKNSADAAAYRAVQTKLAERKLAGQDAAGEAARALTLADSPETAALKEMFKKANPESYARLVKEGRWDTITGVELGDAKEIGKTYRAIISGEASGARQATGFTEAERVRQQSIEQERIRNERELREKEEEERRKAEAKRAEEEAKNRIVDMVQIPGAPQLSETETKDLRNRKAATENLNRQLNRAKQLLADHGLKVLAPSTKGYSLWNSMKGQLKSAYKEQKALGSLDDGVERLVQDITGGTLDIASGNMPGLIEENVAVNQADFETLARNKGWMYPSATPQQSAPASGATSSGPRTPSGKPYKTKAKAKDGSIHYFDENDKEVL